MIINDRRTADRAADIPVSSEELLAQFYQSIRLMNETYELPVKDKPEFYRNMHKRLTNFRTILQKEMEELDVLIKKVPQDLEQVNPDKALAFLVDFADFLGDLVVYEFSEAAKYGINLPEILKLIQISNCTKLDADGNPIKDATGKFLKGPNYKPPEPDIKAYFLSQLKQQSAVLNND